MTLDPIIKQILEAAKELPAPPPLSPAEARAAVKARIALIPPTDAVIDHIRDIVIPLARRKLDARIYRPTEKMPPGLVIFFHGGGWTMCDIDTHDALCRRICADSQTTVISIGYRLAPEHRFPAAFDDCADATSWLIENGSRLELDSRNYILCGDSAGGNLAAAVTLAMRDRGQRSPVAQALIYPALREPRNDGSYLALGSGYGFTSDDAHAAWNSYCPEQPAPDLLPYAAPIHGTGLGKLPPTLILAAEYDLLRDDAQAYFDALVEAGGEAEYKLYPGMTHGFLALEPIIPTARRACLELGEWIAKQLKRP